MSTKHPETIEECDSSLLTVKVGCIYGDDDENARYIIFVNGKKVHEIEAASNPQGPVDALFIDFAKEYNAGEVEENLHDLL